MSSTSATTSSASPIGSFDGNKGIRALERCSAGEGGASAGVAKAAVCSLDLCRCSQRPVPRHS